MLPTWSRCLDPQARPAIPSLGLPPLALILALAGCPPSRPPGPPSTVGSETPDLVVVGQPFSPPGQGQPFLRFIANRDHMHSYLYNGDELFPKQVNLCARGRSTLLDLDLGPGASHELGLSGPAWEAHLRAVALARDPHRPFARKGRTRFLYAWPVVSTRQLDSLREAHDLGRAAREGGARWAQVGTLPHRAHFDAMRPLLDPQSHTGRPLPPESTRSLAEAWARSLMGAILERLWFSAHVLAPEVLGAAAADRDAYEAFVSPMFALDDHSERLVQTFMAALETSAQRRGLLFDSRRFRAFHDRVLLADLGEGWRHGRVSIDQITSIVDQITSRAARFDVAHGTGAFSRASREPPARGVSPGVRRAHQEAAREGRLLNRVRLEAARLRYILDGRQEQALNDARALHGQEALDRDRAAFLQLRGEIEKVRLRLIGHARAGFGPAVRRRLHDLMARGEDPLVAGSFYFETEHLAETTSGFTHAGLIKRLPDPADGVTRLWMFDRVLGFHYAYPVAKLAHSVPVEVLALTRDLRQGRRYQWVRLQVPTRFHLGRGHTSDRVTLVNLFTHLKERLRGCPALITQPGFYYSAISWITAHPENRSRLGHLWTPRVHTGYGYLALHPERLQSLRGQMLYLPVRVLEGKPYTEACPPRHPGPTVQP